MNRIEEIGEQDGWRCWLCDEEVDSSRAANDDRGPSVDSRITRSKAKSKSKRKGTGPVIERLAHRACNTGKGNTDAVVPWADHLFVIDPAQIIPTVERLLNKGGREAIARCPTESDAIEAAAWIEARVARLEPRLNVETAIEPGGGQFLLILKAL